MNIAYLVENIYFQEETVWLEMHLVNILLGWNNSEEFINNLVNQ